MRREHSPETPTPPRQQGTHSRTSRQQRLPTSSTGPKQKQKDNCCATKKDNCCATKTGQLHLLSTLCHRSFANSPRQRTKDRQNFTPMFGHACNRTAVDKNVLMKRCCWVSYAAALVLTGCAQVDAQQASTKPASPPAKTTVLSLGAGHSGIVQSILVQDGAHVEAGQVLLQLDCHSLQKEIDFRAASLAEAEAVLMRVRNGPRPEEIAIGEAAVGVAAARSQQARDALERASALQIGVSITRAELFVVQRDSSIADAQLVDAQKKLDLLNAGSRAEDIAVAQAKRDAAAAFLDEGKADFDQCAVRAPASGTVQVLATLGQFVSVYSPTPLMQLTTDAAPK